MEENNLNNDISELPVQKSMENTNPSNPTKPPTLNIPKLPLSSLKPPLPPTKKVPKLLELPKLKLKSISSNSSPSSPRGSKKNLIDVPKNIIAPLDTTIIPEKLINPKDPPNFDGFSDNEEQDDDFFDDFAFDVPVEQTFDKMILDGKKKCEISVLLQKIRSSH